MKETYRPEQEAIMRRLLPHDLPTPIVDLGGRGYHRWLAGIIAQEFETWDVVEGWDVQRVVDATSMDEIQTASIGMILCTSVLEHIPRPWWAADEIVRVVRPGGQIFVAAPFRYRIHRSTTGDYWRFTPEALAVMFCPEFECLERGWIGREQGAYLYGRRR